MKLRTRIWPRVSAPIFAAAAAAALAGCAFAPLNKPPAPASSASYAAEAPPDTTVAASGSAQHFNAGAQPLPQWWQLYGSDTLDSWVEEGLRNNPSLDAVRHTLEAAHQQFRAQVGGTLLPSIDAGGQVSRQRALGLPDIGPPTNLYNVYAGELSLSYTFDLFGAVRYGIRQAAAQVDLQSYEFTAARRALAANIVIGAINASALTEALSVNERLVQLANEQAELSEKAYRSGSSSHDALLTAQQSAAALDASLPPLRSQALRARHALAVLMGRTPDQAPMPLPLSQLQLPAEVPVSVPSDLLQQRPDVRAAEAAVHITAAQVGVATAQLFPRISVSASYGSATFNSATLFTGAATVWSAGATIAQPIFHGRALLAQRKAAVANYDASVAQYQQTVLNAFQNVADSLTALNQDALALQAAQLALAAARASYAENDSRYHLGSVSYPMSVASEQRWRAATLTEIQDTASRLIDTAALFQAMGNPPNAAPPLELPAPPSAAPASAGQ
jgi:NodT family efflux transporter outer membrane factor (OMF) lipoprotein